MDGKALIQRLDSHQEIYVRLFHDISSAQIAWRPAPDKWSLLEVICHLRDEEREDFRTRLRMTLKDPSQPWPPIDPQGWVSDRAYADQNWPTIVADFLAERRESLAWLATIENPDWEHEYVHPQLGALRAGDLLTSWVAHDLLHIRQILGLQWAWNAKDADPFTPDYAGEW